MGLERQELLRSEVLRDFIENSLGSYPRYPVSLT